MEDFEVRAQNRYVWQSPRKVRLVVDRVRGMDAVEALGVLNLMPQRAADVGAQVDQVGCGECREQLWDGSRGSVHRPDLGRRRADAPLAPVWGARAIQADPEAIVAHHGDSARANARHEF